MKVVFVDSIPKKIEKNIFYISDKYKVITHSCLCGCGRNVSIFIDDGWTYSINKKGQITINPSIATGLDCGSHYWIENNQVSWSNPIDYEEVQARLKMRLEKKIEKRVESKGFMKKINSLMRRIADIFIR